MEKRESCRSDRGLIVAVVGILALSVAVAIPAAKYFADHEVSKIVTGVPAQVEAHRSEEHAKRAPDYYLELEQCPIDVTNAEQGRVTASFDPTVGEYYTGCNVDEVQVGLNTWQTYADGSTIIFSGAPGGQVDRGYFKA